MSYEIFKRESNLPITELYQYRNVLLNFKIDITVCKSYHEINH